MNEIALLNYSEIEKNKEPVATTSKDYTQKTNEVTITSLEIAELTGKRHDHILRDIEDILGKIRDVPKFGEIYKDARNRQQKCYRLPKIEALILISGYSVELREKIILRLDFLEKELRQKSFKPLTLKESLQLSLKLLEQNERLLIENADQKEIINSYKIADRTKRNKQELATLLNRKIRELADKQYARQYAKCYNEVYAEFAKLHCFSHKVDMQFLRTNIDYLSECLKLVLDLLDKDLK